MTVSHEELMELLGAYALDAVDPDEAAEIDLHLRNCPRCRAEVAEHRETAAFLAHAGADAPADVWDRIAGTIDAPAPVVPLAPRLGARTRRGGSWSRAVVLAGVAAAAVIAVLGIQVRNQDRRLDELAAELAASDGGFAAAMAERDAEMVELAGDGTAALPVVLLPDGRAWLQASALPPLPDGRTYQLWGAAGDELVSIAVLGRDPGVISFDAEGYSLLAISEEVAPGVVTSVNPPVVVGEIS